MRDVEYIRCNWYTVSAVVLTHHYLKRMPAGIMDCFAIIDSNNFMTVLGAAVFTNGRIQYEGRFLEFSRLWLDDSMPKNSESRFVGHLLRTLAKKYPTYEGVVTWADPKQGHSGALYRACNFAYDGKSRPTKRYRSKSSGRNVYQRTVVVQSDFQEIASDGGKHRYVYYFDKRRRESTR